MRRLLLYLAVAAVVASSIQASHAVMRRVPFDELVQSSNEIVRGTVAKMESNWSVDGRIIYTTVTVKTERVYKGASPAELTVRIVGGVVDGVGLMVEDMPRFSTGQDVILFLDHDGADYSVNGLFQGKYTVENGTVVESRLPERAFSAKIAETVQRQQR